MDGQLRLKSEDGKGSRFAIQFPLTVPPLDSPNAPDSIGQASTAASTIASVSKSVPMLEGEVMLIDRGSVNIASKPFLTATRSFDDSRSVDSHRSTASRGSGKSNKSDADRLIDAIQTPLDIGEPESEEQSRQRRTSKGAYQSGHRPQGRPKSDTSRSMSPSRPGRPTSLSRSFSSPGGPGGPGGQDHDQSGDMIHADNLQAPTGLEYVTDSKTPIRPVKVPDEYSDQPEHPAQSSVNSGVVFEIGDNTPRAARSTAASTATTLDAHAHQSSQPESAKLQVLVAEDDPINMKILRKRLEKAGHTVHHTVNGEDCAQAYKGSAGKYDVVLMDMQVSVSKPAFRETCLPNYCYRCPSSTAVGARK